MKTFDKKTEELHAVVARLECTIRRKDQEHKQCRDKVNRLTAELILVREVYLAELVEREAKTDRLLQSIESQFYSLLTRD